MYRQRPAAARHNRVRPYTDKRGETRAVGQRGRRGGRMIHPLVARKPNPLRVFFIRCRVRSVHEIVHCKGFGPNDATTVDFAETTRRPDEQSKRKPTNDRNASKSCYQIAFDLFLFFGFDALSTFASSLKIQCVLHTLPRVTVYEKNPPCKSR